MAPTTSKRVTALGGFMGAGSEKAQGGSMPMQVADAAALLVRATEAGDLPQVQALIEAGMDVNAENKFGDTALQCATRCGHVELVDYLCASGADVNVVGMRANTPLEWAAFLGQTCSTTTTSTSLTLLESVNAEVALERLAANNELDARTAAQYQPLHWAATLGHVQVALVLMEYGADANQRTETGRTPLHCAVEHDQLDMIVLLLQSGALLNPVDQWDRTPLHYACARGLAYAADILIKSGADVDAVGTVGVERWSRPLVNLPNYTPLHLCAVMDWLPIAQLLVHRGADPTTKNRFGQSAASLAARHRAGSVLAFLQHVLPPKPPKELTQPQAPVLRVNDKEDRTKSQPPSTGLPSLGAKQELAGAEKAEKGEKKTVKKKRPASAAPKSSKAVGASSRVASAGSTRPLAVKPSAAKGNLAMLEQKAKEEERRLWGSAVAAVLALVDDVCAANVRALREYHHKQSASPTAQLRGSAETPHPLPPRPAGPAWQPGQSVSTAAHGSDAAGPTVAPRAERTTSPVRRDATGSRPANGRSSHNASAYSSAAMSSIETNISASQEQPLSAKAAWARRSSQASVSGSLTVDESIHVHERERPRSATGSQSTGSEMASLNLHERPQSANASIEDRLPVTASADASPAFTLNVRDLVQDANSAAERVVSRHPAAAAQPAAASNAAHAGTGATVEKVPTASPPVGEPKVDGAKGVVEAKPEASAPAPAASAAPASGKHVTFTEKTTEPAGVANVDGGEWDCRLCGHGNQGSVENCAACTRPRRR